MIGEPLSPGTNAEKLSREDVETWGYNLTNKFRATIKNHPEFGKARAKDFFEEISNYSSDGGGEYVAAFQVIDGIENRKYIIRWHPGRRDDYWPTDNVQWIKIHETVLSSNDRKLIGTHNLELHSVADLSGKRPDPTVYFPRIIYSEGADSNIESTTLAVQKAEEMLARLTPQK